MNCIAEICRAAPHFHSTGVYRDTSSTPVFKIAFLTPYTPTRIRTRSFHFLKTLSRNGHAVTLFTVWTDQAEHRALQELEAFGIHIVATPLHRRRVLWNSLRGLASTVPIQARYSWEPGLATRWLNAIRAAEFDIIHVEHLRGALYGLRVRHAAGASAPPVIWDSVDCISGLFQNALLKSVQRTSRLITRLELGRTRTFEARAIRTFDETLVVTEAERQQLLALPSPKSSADPAPRVHVVPNGVDVEFFCRTTNEREPATLILSGKMSYHANITAAHFLLDEIMPRVWAVRGDVQVLIVGADPPLSLKERAARSNGRVVVTGTVADVRPYMERATLAVAPMVYGAGVQNKVLEAMAMQIPVITSPLAAAPLGAQPDRELWVATDAAEFAAKIIAALDAPARRAALAQNGLCFVQDQYSVRASLEKLQQVYTIARQRHRGES
jgi:glycosyltransferase involved in cell wall biosynthesis